MCKGKIVACMSLCVSFPFIDISKMHIPFRPYSEKVDFIEANVTHAAEPFLTPGA